MACFQGNPTIHFKDVKRLRFSFLLVYWFLGIESRVRVIPFLSVACVYEGSGASALGDNYIVALGYKRITFFLSITIIKAASSIESVLDPS